MNKIIKNNVKNCSSVPLDDLISLQGKLKKTDPEKLLKLRNSIIRKGLVFPLFTWKDIEKNIQWLIDGVHRTICLRELRDMGYEIESVPLVQIKAPDKRTAKKFILLANSHYSRITKQGFNIFVEDLNLDEFIGDLNFDDIKLEFHVPIDDEEEKDLDTTVQFIYTKYELKEIQEWLNKLRTHFGLEKDIDIILKVLKNSKRRLVENG